MRARVTGRSFRRARSYIPKFKAISALIVIVLYVFVFRKPTPSLRRAPIQLEIWPEDSGAADADKVTALRAAMKHTFWRYREKAWGSDGIKPISGDPVDDRNGWGCFIIDASTTLAMMGLWAELKLAVDHIVEVQFNVTETLVDPFETTIRYLGAMVSLVDLVDTGMVPDGVIPQDKRDGILSQAEKLADNLAPAYSSGAGIPYPRVNFTAKIGVPDTPELRQKYAPGSKNTAVGPARAGTTFLEHRTLSRLSRKSNHQKRAQSAWSKLVWNESKEPFVGMVEGPIDVETGAAVGRKRHWDAGHDSYYEYLIKTAILNPKDTNAEKYQTRWKDAAFSLRQHLASRSAPGPPSRKGSAGYEMQHLFIGKFEDDWYLNEMSHLACFAPGNLMLGGRWLSQTRLVTFGKALLEGCRHTYNGTATKIGPELFSWTPSVFSSPGFQAVTFEPQTKTQERELRDSGFWIADPVYRLRPEYVESLFYAWRITGEQRYRDWAWDAFQAIETQCRTAYGYASLADVNADRFVSHTTAGKGSKHHKGKSKTHKLQPAAKQKKLSPASGTDFNDIETGDDTEPKKDVIDGLIDESESFWAAETLKYLFLTFSDVSVGSLDKVVYSTEGHPFHI